MHQTSAIKKSRKSNHHRYAPVCRFVLCMMMLVIMTVGTTKPAQTAGLYTHTWFVDQALSLIATQPEYAELESILRDNLSIVNYGAIFPDITYTLESVWVEKVHDTVGVGANNMAYQTFMVNKGYNRKDRGLLQVAYYREFLTDRTSGASVPQFRAELINQIRSHFEANPRTLYDKQAVAFLFGVIAHQEADLPWHFGYGYQGMNTGCDDPTYLGIGWGFECQAWRVHDYWDPLTREVQLDQILYHFDTANEADFNFFGAAKAEMYAASDALGYARPECDLPFFCMWGNPDAVDNGLERQRIAWNTGRTDLGENAGMRNAIVEYAPGGVEYGSTLVAATWMVTWDNLFKHHRIYLPSVGK
jgi:hypothetical protein